MTIPTMCSLGRTVPGAGTVAPGGIGVLRILGPRTGTDGAVIKDGVGVDTGESCAKPEIGSSTSRTSATAPIDVRACKYRFAPAPQ